MQKAATSSTQLSCLGLAITGCVLFRITASKVVIERDHILV